MLLMLPAGKAGQEYLRIHIRANSNMTADQNVKYEIKDKIVEYLTPYLINAADKNSAIEIVSSLTANIEKLCDDFLSSQNFSYKSKAAVKNETFPARTYDGITLESGSYDALIISLGSGEGDNWWCVVYPPLCFVNSDCSNNNIYYKSKLKEIIDNFFK